jgi:superfamily II DNA or RNA helicase
MSTSSTSVDDTYDCDKCNSDQPTREVPWTIFQFRAIFRRLTPNFEEEDFTYRKAKIANKEREWFCDKLKRDTEFCELMKTLLPPLQIRKKLLESQNQNQRDQGNQNKFVLSKLKALDLKGSGESSDSFSLQVPFLANEVYDKYKTFTQYQNAINQVVSRYAWKKPRIENKCRESGGGNNNDSRKNKVLELNPTQAFIKAWVSPNMKTKGMLLFHSVGSGKTCSAIASASAQFTKQGWTILWVSRRTLISGIWKNVFDLICEENMARYIEETGDNVIPEDYASRKRLLRSLIGNRWVPPTSFKSFSNVCEGKRTELYKELEKRNGKDIFAKTLIIIDEVHKLFSSEDLLVQERPKYSAILKAMQRSYRASGENSCRAMLMTATPVPLLPTDLTRTLNLICESRDGSQYGSPLAFPETMNDMYEKQWVRETEGSGFTEKGKREFLNAARGLISFLDRTSDPRQFAQIRLHSITVAMSGKHDDYLTPASCKEVKDIEQEDCKEKFQVGGKIPVSSRDAYKKCIEEAREKEKECRRMAREHKQSLGSTQEFYLKSKCKVDGL